jgi:hypothetical protein
MTFIEFSLVHAPLGLIALFRGPEAYQSWKIERGFAVDPNAPGLPPIWDEVPAAAPGPSSPKPKRQPQKPIHIVRTLVDGERITRRFLEVEAQGEVASEWVLLAPQNGHSEQRSAELSEADFDELESIEFVDFKKAAALKPLWADGFTNAKIVAQFAFDGDVSHGFGLRTVEAYTSAFSRALSLKKERA